MGMPHNKRVFIRSMKAKMSTLKRPMVWGSAAVVLMASYLGFDYLTHPERLQFSGQSETESLADASRSVVNPAADVGVLPPSEDNGIGADIDSLALLFNEIRTADSREAEDANPSTTESEPDSRSRRSLFSLDAPYDLLPSQDSSTAGQSSDESTSFYSRVFSSASSAAAADLVPSSPALRANSWVYSSSGEGAIAAETSIRTESASSGTNAAARSSQSLSQLDRSLQQLSQPRSPDSPSSSPFADPLSIGVPVSPGYANDASSPNPGTTGYSVPPALRSPVNPYTRTANPLPQVPASQSELYTPSNSYGNYGVSTPQPRLYSSPSAYPSSVPNSVPNGAGYTVTPTPVPTFPSGTPTSPNSQPNSNQSSSPNSRRYSGGGRNGQINTFSNP